MRRIGASGSIAIAMAVLLSGCAGITDTADVFPMNAAAQRLGPVKATFERTGTGRGPVTFTIGTEQS